MFGLGEQQLTIRVVVCFVKDRYGDDAGLALIAFIFGILTDRKIKAVLQLREQPQGMPSDEQMAQIQVLRKQLTTYLNFCTATLVLALWVMAKERYLFI